MAEEKNDTFNSASEPAKHALMPLFPEQKVKRHTGERPKDTVTSFQLSECNYESKLNPIQTGDVFGEARVRPRQQKRRVAGTSIKLLSAVVVTSSS